MVNDCQYVFPSLLLYLIVKGPFFKGPFHPQQLYIFVFPHQYSILARYLSGKRLSYTNEEWHIWKFTSMQFKEGSREILISSVWLM